MHDELFYQHKVWLRQNSFYNNSGTRAGSNYSCWAVISEKVLIRGEALC